MGLHTSQQDWVKGECRRVFSAHEIKQMERINRERPAKTLALTVVCFAQVIWERLPQLVRDTIVAACIVTVVLCWIISMEYGFGSVPPR